MAYYLWLAVLLAVEMRYLRARRHELTVRDALLHSLALRLH